MTPQNQAEQAGPVPAADTANTGPLKRNDLGLHWLKLDMPEEISQAVCG